MLDVIKGVGHFNRLLSLRLKSGDFMKKTLCDRQRTSQSRLCFDFVTQSIFLRHHVQGCLLS